MEGACVVPVYNKRENECAYCGDASLGIPGNAYRQVGSDKYRKSD